VNGGLGDRRRTILNVEYRMYDVEEWHTDDMDWEHG